MDASNQEKASENDPSSFWTVWKTAEALESSGMMLTTPSALYDEILLQVVSILRQWGGAWAGEPEWQSLLNKSSLRHEVEESIVALHHLHKWLTSSQNQSPAVVVVDMCCGKGLFSMLLSYMVGSYWKDQYRVISRIVLLDRATRQTLNWSHIDVANSTAAQEQRPPMDLWEGCSLHDYDDVLDRLQFLNLPIAMVGIHTCKTLGPACVGFFNGLGASKCPFLCLAPCCLPRVAIATSKKHTIRTIPVRLYESPEDRQGRLEATKLRERALRRRHVVCFLCKSDEHITQECELLPSSEEERLSVLKEATLITPCWRCGVVGHFKADCPSPLRRPERREPPSLTMDVTQVLQSAEPFDTYCRLLFDTLQECSTKALVDPGLINSSAAHQHAKNWNGNRKSCYIIATR